MRKDATVLALTLTRACQLTYQEDKDPKQFLNMAQRWQYYHDVGQPHWCGMEGSTPMKEL